MLKCQVFKSGLYGLSVRNALAKMKYFRMLLCSWEYFRMLLCSSWSSSGFMWMNGQICMGAFADECHMNFWVVLWRLSLHDFRMLFRSDLLWNLSWNMCRISQSGAVTSLPCFREFGLLCSVPTPLYFDFLLNQTWSCFWICFLLSNHCIVHVRKSMEQVELSELRGLQNVSFVSLRMICKTLIWCNQIQIVKHWWNATWKISRMIFLMKYS